MLHSRVSSTSLLSPTTLLADFVSLHSDFVSLDPDLWSLDSGSELSSTVVSSVSCSFCLFTAGASASSVQTEQRDTLYGDTHTVTHDYQYDRDNVSMIV